MEPIQGTISIDAENIMPVIKKWLYSDKDIFVREVVSNGCDAVSKMKRLLRMGEARRRGRRADPCVINVIDKAASAASVYGQRHRHDRRRGQNVHRRRWPSPAPEEFMKKYQDTRMSEEAASSATSVWASTPCSWSLIRWSSTP